MWVTTKTYLHLTTNQFKHQGQQTTQVSASQGTAINCCSCLTASFPVTVLGFTQQEGFQFIFCVLVRCFPVVGVPLQLVLIAIPQLCHSLMELVAAIPTAGPKCASKSPSSFTTVPCCASPPTTLQGPSSTIHRSPFLSSFCSPVNEPSSASRKPDPSTQRPLVHHKTLLGSTASSP